MRVKVVVVETKGQHVSGGVIRHTGRHAGATLLQRFIYEIYPRRSDLATAAAVRVHTLGGTDLQPEFGPVRRRLAHLIGWKLTKRLHNLL